MKTIIIETKEERGDYPIVTGKGALRELGRVIDLEAYSHIGVLSDENVIGHWRGGLQNATPQGFTEIIVSPGEQAKHIDTLRDIWRQLVRSGFDRKSLLLNVGGGVIGDMGGFAAACYMRGIAFAQVPTTVVGQVDAAIGGKVGIDFAGLKNMVGLFAPPKAVIADTATLSTLPDRELRSGFAEVLKHGLVRDKAYAEQASSKAPGAFSPEELEDIVARSCEIKTAIVREDAKEGGARKLLNFGHTIGHAVEAVSLETQEPFLHGEAVAIGMVAEASTSKELGLLSEEEAAEVERMVKQLGLPAEIPSSYKAEDILEKMKGDKKSEQGTVQWTLLEGIGSGVVHQQVPDKIIREVLHS